jgi:hypothetical protein
MPCEIIGTSLRHTSPLFNLDKGCWLYLFYHSIVPLLSLGYTPHLHASHFFTKTYYNIIAKVLFVVCIPHLSHLPTLNIVKHLMIWEDKALPLALPNVSMTCNNKQMHKYHEHAFKVWKTIMPQHDGKYVTCIISYHNIQHRNYIDMTIIM